MIDQNEIEKIRADLAGHARSATDFLKAFSHPDRLMILCHLIDGEKTVTELETLTGSRQSSVSQHLAKLRNEAMVNTRRDGKAIHYSLSDDRALEMISLLHRLFCDSKRRS